MRLGEGRPEPLGVTPGPGGANVAVRSQHGTAVDLCLFGACGRETRHRLPARTGAVWHGFVPDLAPGRVYGFRVHGPWDPAAGHRFNPAKLLLDPYARALTGPLVAPEAALGHDPGADDLAIGGTDSAPHVAKAVVAADPPPVDPAERPRVPWADTVICEAHVKGLTHLWPGLPDAVRGRFEALGEGPVIDHLRALGITTLELLPVQAFVDERRLTRLGLVNYWGYNPVAFLVPEPRYLGPRGPAGLRDAIRRLHAAGIEVILDICLNHTGEGDELGPTLCFRGLDNAAYYALAEDGRHYRNETGCGNRLDFGSPPVLRLALDALRWWVERMGADGFRFDLAPALLRGPGGVAPGSPFLAALLQDPVLREVKLIAEPWDAGPDGYRTGGFPAPFAEWNDRFRDGVRRFWRGDPGAAGAMGDALLGSARLFDRGGRRPWSSVNHITSHDGFTLADLASYREKHNEANGEDNRDGHGENLSDNCGVEGPTADPAIRARRALRMRSLMATLFLAQGTPMLRAGDEIGQSQQGNNNAYAQDNRTSWIDRTSGDADLLNFTARLAAFRREHSALRQTGFLHGAARPEDGLPDAEWQGFDGGPVAWEDPDLARFCLILRGTGPAAGRDTLLLAFNAGGRAELRLPALPAGWNWRRAVDTADPAMAASPATGGSEAIAAGSLAVFVAAADR
jgi:glycogen operon protein